MTGPEDAASVIELFRTQYDRYAAAGQGRAAGTSVAHIREEELLEG
jgi:hypothetical protein